MFSVIAVLVGQISAKTSESWITDNILFQEHLAEYLVKYESDILLYNVVF